MRGAPSTSRDCYWSLTIQRLKISLLSLTKVDARRATVEFDTRLQDVLATFRRRDAEHAARNHTTLLKEGRLAEEEESALLKSSSNK